MTILRFNDYSSRRKLSSDFLPRNSFNCTGFDFLPTSFGFCCPSGLHIETRFSSGIRVLVKFMKITFNFP